MSERNKELICPIMAIGWFANKYAAKTENKTFMAENIPPCHKERCPLWGNGRCSFGKA